MSLSFAPKDTLDIVVSTRIRLARNLKDYPFAAKISVNQTKDMIAAVREALEKNHALRARLKFMALNEQNGIKIRALVERRLISPEFANLNTERFLIYSEDGYISIMVNEEDHLRLQVIKEGFFPDECMKEAVMLDMLLDESLQFAYNEELGYLTHCPTNLGTGLRASAMLHLPLLTRSGEVSSMIADAGKIGIAVRGVYGEGSKVRSELYQISNQMTLGFTEEEITERLKSITGRIISRERALREAALKESPYEFEDRIFRSVVVLQNARLMSAAEAENLISDLRLGLSCGIVSGMDFAAVNRILYEIGPANIMLMNDPAPLPADRDKFRAAYLREKISCGKK